MLLSAVDEHRAQINGITTIAENDIASYAGTILNEAPEQVAAQLRIATPAVIQRYGDVAAVSGALFYETNRPAPGFTADITRAPLGDQLLGALGWAFSPLFNPDQFELGPAEAVNRISGVVQRFVAEGDRETIRGAAKRDSLSTGVAQYARASACSFCALMAAQSSRGGHWHNSCKCVAVPTWRDAPAPSSHVRDQQSAAASGAIRALEDARSAHPDFGRMRSRQFFAAHPELALTNKNITRMMRDLYGFAH
jgi:hypothetical protein